MHGGEVGASGIVDGITATGKRRAGHPPGIVGEVDLRRSARLDHPGHGEVVVGVVGVEVRARGVDDAAVEEGRQIHAVRQAGSGRRVKHAVNS